MFGASPPLSFGEGLGVRFGSEALQVACVFHSVRMNRSVEKGNVLGATHSVRNVPTNILEPFLRNVGFGGRDAFLPSVPSLTGWRLTPPMPPPMLSRRPVVVPSSSRARSRSAPPRNAPRRASHRATRPAAHRRPLPPVIPTGASVCAQHNLPTSQPPTPQNILLVRHS
jgi:hypothetical protein